MNIATVHLKKYEDRRIKSGHLWIYSNEIETAISPLANFKPGQIVHIENYEKKLVGTGYINPNTLLCVRILSHDPKMMIDHHFFEKRIQQAVALRNHYFQKPFYRLVYGESDGLPGLIVDRYGDHLVVQITTAGMECLKDELIIALCNVMKPSSILFRNDTPIRELEGLPCYTQAAFGAPPDLIELEENEVTFITSVWEGQKTGWFFDHRDNRARLKKYVKNKHVLDLFSYIGGWGVQAAAWGASSVLCVDSSEKSLNFTRENAKINQLEDKIQTLNEDVFVALKQLHQQQKIFDVIILDPPAFIKKRKDIQAGAIAYQRINELALRLIAENGILITSSCSLHCSDEMLKAGILKGSVKTNRSVRILEQGHQGIDHPVHLAIPETDYLKTFFCHVS